MKTILVLLLTCGGCVAPFTLLEETEPVGEATAADPTEAVYPSSSAVVPVPLPPRSMRPGPGQGRSR